MLLSWQVSSHFMMSPITLSLNMFSEIITISLCLYISYTQNTSALLKLNRLKTEQKSSKEDTESELWRSPYDATAAAHWDWCTPCSPTGHSRYTTASHQEERDTGSIDLKMTLRGLFIVLGLIAVAYAEELKVESLQKETCEKKSKTGDMLTLHYTGTLLETGKKFDSR